MAGKLQSKAFHMVIPEEGQKIDIGKQIFCYRSVNMRSVIAVGLDVDYILSQ